MCFFASGGFNFPKFFIVGVQFIGGAIIVWRCMDIVTVLVLCSYLSLMVFHTAGKQGVK